MGGVVFETYEQKRGGGSDGDAEVFVANLAVWFTIPRLTVSFVRESLITNTHTYSLSAISSTFALHMYTSV